MAAASACPLPFPVPSFSPYSAIAAVKKAGYAYCDLKTRREKSWPFLTPREADAAEELIIAGRRGKAGISIADLAPRLNLSSHAWTRKLVRNAETKIASVSKQRGFQSPIEISARVRLRDGTEKKIPGKRGGRRNWYEFSLEGLKQLSPFYKPKPPNQPKPETTPQKVNSYEQSSTFVRSPRGRFDDSAFDGIFRSAFPWLRKGSVERAVADVLQRSKGPQPSAAPARIFGSREANQILPEPSGDPGSRPGDSNRLDDGKSKGPPG